LNQPCASTNFRDADVVACSPDPISFVTNTNVASHWETSALNSAFAFDSAFSDALATSFSSVDVDDDDASFFFASVVLPSSFSSSSNAANISHCQTHVLQFPLLLSKALADYILQFPLLLSCPAITLALHFVFLTCASCSRRPLYASSSVISSPLR
jgi:hypothetical protein